ncbi:mucin-5AC isoform X1 [Oreochromis niloticus]|uniref:mucin-5AC isoform X1 n=1 Tax=Oreochromis niloticus TaxID=8128 RepID=UPI0003942841|nr:mucin-5AC isoform X1 [Oreochromis niloticus]
MKMRNLLLAVVLGLLAAVHSTPVNTVTQNPDNPDEGFLKDAMTEGFIVGPSPTLTTETPKINATVQASQTPVYNSEDMTEGSAAGKISDISTTSISPHETTTLSISHAQTSAFIGSPVSEGSGLGETSDESPIPFTLDTTTTNATNAPTSNSTESYVFEGSAVESPIPFTLDTTTTNATNAPTSNSTESYMFEGSAVESTIPIALDTTTATHAPTSDFTERYMLEGRGSGYASPSLISHTTTTSVPSEDQSSKTSNSNVLSQTTDPAVSTSDVTTNLDSGSGSELVETTTVSSKVSRQNRNFLYNNKGQQASQTQTQTTNTEPTHKGHVTPDWIIILGFIVGVAALVILCVAIATRHKWNGPNQANLTVATNNQQREREMETFLPNEKPKENGNSGEYTVIPLEDIPQNGPSH